ncbi:MAG: universal stress protein [Xanthobacteraceae bacterium]|nr:universal stress protein [Xanthobacteraceae bacterium]
MYKRILVATDGSELANRAVAHGIALAKALNAPLSVVAVTDIWSPFEMAHDFDQRKKDPIGTYEALAATGAKRVLDKVAEMAKAQGVDCTLVHVADKRPADGIIEASKTAGADLIVMASHGRRGINRLLLGSQANEVVTTSKVPVLIVR